MKLITVLWGIFALLFLGLAIFHWRASLQAMPHFDAKPTSGIGTIDGVQIARSGFKTFIPEMNSFIDEQNESSRKQNVMAAIGYLLACITAILSVVLTVDRCSKGLNSILKSCFIQRSQ